jgi:hypothetical protein
MIQKMIIVDQISELLLLKKQLTLLYQDLDIVAFSLVIVPSSRASCTNLLRTLFSFQLMFILENFKSLLCLFLVLMEILWTKNLLKKTKYLRFVSQFL